jgi:mannosyltransferase
MNNSYPGNKTKLAFILFLAILIRLLGIFSRPIWYDEAFSLLFANTSPADMIYGTLTLGNTGSADIHPLGYYFLLWGWIQLFGPGIFAARALSIIINIFSLLLIYEIAKHLFNEKIALISVFSASILAFQVHYAQEIRMYALLEFLLLLSTFSFFKGTSGHWSWWLVFGISSALAQFTHSLAAFYLIALATIPLFKRDYKTFRSVFFAGLFAILLYLPWLSHLPAQFSKVNAAYWVEKPGLEKIFTFILLFLTHLPVPPSLLFPSLLIALLTMAFIMLETWKARKAGEYSSDTISWVIYLALIPPALLWLGSQFIPVYIERVLLPSHAMFCIWLAWVLSRQNLQRPVLLTITGLILISSGIGIYQHVSYDDFPYGPYDSLARELAENSGKNSIIVHSNKLSYLPTLYFNSVLDQVYIADPQGGRTDTLAPATREVLNLHAINSVEDIDLKAEHVWYIIYQSSIDEYTSQGFQVHPDILYLDAHYRLESREKRGDLWLYSYTGIDSP